MITATTYITTLFTREYLASVTVFLINLPLLPFYIWITDPIIRAYQELGRFLLTLRVFIIIALVTALYFGSRHFDLRGIIAIVIATALIDKFVSATLVLKKLNVKKRDAILLKDVWKTALASLIAGCPTFLFYWQFNEIIQSWGTNLMQSIFTNPKQSLSEFVSGSLVLISSAVVFTPIYLFAMNRFGVIEEAEKEKLRSIVNRLLSVVRKFSIQNPKSEIQN